MSDTILKLVKASLWIRCAFPACRRRVRSWYIVEACPAGDGWLRLSKHAAADRWVCPIHGLEIDALLES